MKTDEPNPSYKLLRMADGHQMCYTTHGVPGNIPVLFLHGGPGLGFSESDKRFFNPARFFAVFYDQRGAPKSLPVEPPEHHTPQKMVEDISTLIDHFAFDKVILFGGSWGSTLALLFAIAHPDRVSGMVLRGIFPGTRESIEYYTHGQVGTFHPEAWERFQAHIPEECKADSAKYYYDQMRSSDADRAHKYAYEWARFGLSIAIKNISEMEIDEMLEVGFNKNESLLEACYSVNYCFLPDRFIMKNIGAVADIPVRIIHGRYDMICPPKYAYELHQALNHSKLYFPDAGHASFEPAIEKLLIAQLNDLSEAL